MDSPTPAAATGAPAERPSVAVSYEHSTNLSALLERLDLSVMLSTYQAGRVVSLGCHGGHLQVGFSRFDQAMGLCRTPTGLAVGSRDAIWNLPASREIALRITPEGEHDIAFLARSCHHSGPLMGHDLAWCDNRLWLVNTLFNGLATIEGSWSFMPQARRPATPCWRNSASPRPSKPLKGPGCQAPATWYCSSPCAIWIRRSATGGPA